MQDLGEFEVKHGVRISVVNLYTDEVGNPELPKISSSEDAKTRMRWATMMAALFALAAIVAGIAMVSRHRVGSTLAAPEKSIAVLAV